MRSIVVEHVDWCSARVVTDQIFQVVDSAGSNPRSWKLTPSYVPLAARLWRTSNASASSLSGDRNCEDAMSEPFLQKRVTQKLSCVKNLNNTASPRLKLFHSVSHCCTSMLNNSPL